MKTLWDVAVYDNGFGCPGNCPRLYRTVIDENGLRKSFFSDRDEDLIFYNFEHRVSYEQIEDAIYAISKIKNCDLVDLVTGYKYFFPSQEKILSEIAEKIN